jgi:hypothetical protein
MSGMAVTRAVSWSTRRLPNAQKNPTRARRAVTMTSIVATPRGIQRASRETAGSIARATNQLMST